MQSERIIFKLCAIFAGLFCLSACDYWTKQLDDTWGLTAIDLSPTNLYTCTHGSCDGVAVSKVNVFLAGIDETYLVYAGCQTGRYDEPCVHPMIYYYIQRDDEEPLHKSGYYSPKQENHFGPYSELEYLKKKHSLNLPEFCYADPLIRDDYKTLSKCPVYPRSCSNPLSALIFKCIWDKAKN